VSRTFRRHNLASEASRRFERGTDMGAAYPAARRAAELIRDLAGGTISPGMTIAGSVRPLPGLVLRDRDLPARILGLAVPPARVEAILRASGVEVTPVETGWRLTPPTWRRDLADPYDYVEEVGRKIGFAAITGRVPPAPPSTGYTRAQRARRAVLDAVAGAGFVEVMVLPFIGEADLDQLRLPPEDPRRRLVGVANPLSEAQPYLRTTLLPGLFAAVNRNTSRSLADLALFECGLVFRATDQGASIMPDVSRRPSAEQVAQLFDRLPDQPRHLAGVLTGSWLPASPARVAEPVSWAHAVHLADAAAQALGVTLARRASAQLPWHPGRCAELGVTRQGQFHVVGWAGQVHPHVIEAAGLPQGTCAVEVDLDALIALAPITGHIEGLSSHPATKQDVALVVDATVPQARVEAALRQGAGPLLESIRLFDHYTGPQIGPGQQSLAYNLVFRAPDRTLTEAEASQARAQAVAEATRQWGAVLRG
jgi:phenylalanyl-tRNA synthetase beta chain